jgi:Domain of unknown function (DUF4145)
MLMIDDHSSADEVNPALDFLRRACGLFCTAEERTLVDMKCPFCNHDVPPLWQKLCVVTGPAGATLQAPKEEISVAYPAFRSESAIFPRWLTVRLRWMQCPNEECREILVVVNRAVGLMGEAPDDASLGDTWLALPKKLPPRGIDPLVCDPFRRDYLEASAILPDSPRMSAVLSRRILEELLAKYANLSGYKLSKQTEKFVNDASQPSRLRENVEYLREIADFGAHTQKDETGTLVEVTREEAEWTLEVIDGFFEHFIIGPEQDKIRRAKFDEKIEKAGRKPIKKPKPSGN